MNYSELTTAIEDTIEHSFTETQLKDFVQQAEKRIYATVQFPALRKNSTGTLTASDQYLAMPTDMIWVYSIAIRDANSEWQFLLDKDVNFIREAYPNASIEGQPKHYALFNEDYFILGPTPDSGYAVEIHYGYSPESIVTASTTWLGDNFDVALLNGALREAARFLKLSPDMVQVYDKLWSESLILLREMTDGKMRKDAYRSGQFRFEAGQGGK